MDRIEKLKASATSGYYMTWGGVILNGIALVKGHIKLMALGNILGMAGLLLYTGGMVGYFAMRLGKGGD
jgi:hypothetical protein